MNEQLQQFRLTKTSFYKFSLKNVTFYNECCTSINLQ